MIVLHSRWARLRFAAGGGCRLPSIPAADVQSHVFNMETAMARRLLAAAFAAVLLAPAAATAQLMPLQDDPFWTPRFRITPFVGYLTAVDREETWTSEGERSTVIMHTAGATMVGANLEMLLSGKWGVTAAAAFGPRGETTVEFFDDGSNFLVEGSNIFLARVAGSFSLREQPDELTMRRLNATVFAGGVAMMERPRDEPTGEQALDNAFHFGVNTGINGELPFASDRFALQLGVENNFMWWGSQSDLRTASEVANTWLLRGGISFRFR